MTRHNAGFLLADVLADQWRLSKFSRVGPSLVAKGRRRRREVVVLKPQTWMNRSGDAVADLVSRYPIDPADELLVLVDDFALPLGTIRLRARGSAGGHNGLESVEQAVGQGFARLRIGIGPLPDDIDDTADWVLQHFSQSELDELVERVPEMHDAVECWLVEGIETAMNRYNRKGDKRE